MPSLRIDDELFRHMAKFGSMVGLESVRGDHIRYEFGWEWYFCLARTLLQVVRGQRWIGIGCLQIGASLGLLCHCLGVLGL